MINWHAVDNAMDYYHLQFYNKDDYDSWCQSYRKWMLEENGIEHNDFNIQVVDEQLYAMFLLRWA